MVCSSEQPQDEYMAAPDAHALLVLTTPASKSTAAGCSTDSSRKVATTCALDNLPDQVLQKIVQMMGTDSNDDEDSNNTQKLMQICRSMAQALSRSMVSCLSVTEDAEVEGIKQVLKWAQMRALDLGYTDESMITPCLSAVCGATLKRLDLCDFVIDEAQLKQMMQLTNLQMITLGGLELTSDHSDCKTPWKTMALLNYDRPISELAKYPLHSLTFLAFVGSHFCFNLSGPVKVIEAAAANIKKVAKVCFGTPSIKAGADGGAVETLTIEKDFEITWQFSKATPSSEARQMVIAATSAISFAERDYGKPSGCASSGEKETETKDMEIESKEKETETKGIQMDLRSFPHWSAFMTIAKWCSGHIAKVQTDSLALVGQIPKCVNQSRYLTPPGLPPKQLKTAPPTALLKALRQMEGLESLDVQLQDMTKTWKHDLVYITRMVVQSLVIDHPARHLPLLVFPPPTPEGKSCREMWRDIYNEADVIDRRIERASEAGLPGWGMYVETQYDGPGNFWWDLDIVEDRYKPNC